MESELRIHCKIALQSVHCNVIMTDYLKVTIIYGYKFYQILKIVDLPRINLSDFAIICSINLKIYDKF